MEIHSYKDLIVWQKSMDLIVEVYKLTETFPKSEIYGLTSQMRRSSISIPSNIAEGRLRSTQKDYHLFLVHSYASGAELETQIEIAKRLRFGNISQYKRVDSLLNEVMRMLNTIVNKTRLQYPKKLIS